MRTHTEAQTTQFGLGLVTLLLVILFLPITARSQWTNGTNISNTNSGNVGVGTSTPGAKFDVSAGATARGTHTDVLVGAGGNTPQIELFGTSVSSAIKHEDAYGLTFFTNGPSWRSSLFIGHNGNVGVGTTTPSNLLHVNNSGGTGTMMVSGSGSGVINLRDLGAAANTQIFQWRSEGGVFRMASVNDSQGNYVTQNILVAKPDGNVGFGTATPNYPIEVVTNQNAVARIGFNNSSNGASAQAAFSFFEGATEKAKVGVNSSGASSYVGGINALLLWNFQNAPVVFGTNSAERMRVTANGNVGIGNNNPISTLDVTGQIRATSFVLADGTPVGGGGTITGVVATSPGLSGGGTTGSVTLTNTDRGSAQYIFKNVANGGGGSIISATENNDTLTIAGAGGTTVSFSGKTITIDGSTSNVPAAKVSAGTFGSGSYTFNGNVTVNGTVEGTNIKAKYQDVAEWVDSSQELQAATVVVLDTTKNNHVIASTQSYDSRIAGVISAQPGIALGEQGEGRLLVATTGRVKVKVDASKGPIQIGDLLVTSDKEGFAMKSSPVEVGGIRIHRPGTLIGKALEPLVKGTGEILVLLSLQ